MNIFERIFLRNYILNKNSSTKNKSNYEIALKSIRLKVKSADYINFDAMTKEEYNKLINEIINNGYVLNENSSKALSSNPDIVFNSIKKDIETIDYSSIDINDIPKYPKIFKCLLENDCFKKPILRAPLINCLDSDILKIALSKTTYMNINNKDFMNLFKNYPNQFDKYIDRICSLLTKALNNYPKISDFKSAFEYTLEEEWQDYRDKNEFRYDNIFERICDQLKKQIWFDDAKRNLIFLHYMQETLGTKYSCLIKAMEEYHKIIHSDDENEFNNIDNSRDTIASLSASYVSKSKENYKKETINEYNSFLKDFFIPRKNNPAIYKNIEKIQREFFYNSYIEKNEGTIEFLDKLDKKIKYDFKFDDSLLLNNMIENFLGYNYSNMNSFIKAPRGYNNYKRYEKAKKLITRLNKKYINYSSEEVINYLDIIVFDNNENKYIYIGPTFNDDEIVKYNEYDKKKRIFEIIKREIMFKVKSIDINIEIDRDTLKYLEDDINFNDKNFEFDLEYFKNRFELINLVQGFDYNKFISPDTILDDEAYEVLSEYLTNNGLIWLLLFINKHTSYVSFYNFGIDESTITEIINNMKEIIKFSKIYNYDLNNISNIMSLNEISICSDEQSLAILGKDIVEKLYKNYKDSKKIIKMAQELVCQMAKRNNSTVPYIEGSNDNYKYSMYDSLDETILLAGINTNACFTIDGYDNDFLHYCALDKNGFVIKITDAYGNFVARASGFRNGNCVFINQLRTIYDKFDNFYQKEKIIEAFKKACLDIVETSQKNTEELNKIDYVFVTKSYALNKINSNVSLEVTNKIGNHPMDNSSTDWRNFTKNTVNLDESNFKNYFNTDYGNYPIICIASSKGYQIKAENIKQGNVKAVYKRKRNKIIIVNNINEEIISRINKINGIFSYLNNQEFTTTTSIIDGSTIFIGDNWYIVYNNGKIINSCVLDFDKDAKHEFYIVSDILTNYSNEIDEIKLLEEINYKTLKLK